MDHVWFTVLSLLDSNTLLSTCLVSRKFKIISTELLYKNVKVLSIGTLSKLEHNSNIHNTNHLDLSCLSHKRSLINIPLANFNLNQITIKMKLNSINYDNCFWINEINSSNLKHVSLNSCSIKTISILFNLELKSLSINYCDGISSISGIQKCTKLTDLSLIRLINCTDLHLIKFLMPFKLERLIWILILLKTGCLIVVIH